MELPKSFEINMPNDLGVVAAKKQKLFVHIFKDTYISKKKMPP